MKKLILICAALTILAACQKQETKTAAAPPEPAKMAVVPTVTQAPPAATPDKVTGVVAETMDSAGYTYARLTTDSGEKWVVVRQTAIKPGSTITVVTNMVADKFESKTLKRTFDRLVFGELEGAGPATIPMHASTAAGNTPAASPTQVMMPPHAMASSAPVDNTPISVAKAEGDNAKTVAEIWAARTTARDGQPVVVRGKVVKFLSGIMGKNWVHVRDGSGSQEKGDNDITVTTNDTVAVGSVVVVSGVLHLNKDFGAGYSYPVIIEEAKVK